ncbi:MAG TPA: hypothetical protein VJT81_13380 [Burkholderiales bacterium]|nr:hypothetical protein [Burkholderiales bacterium]
MNSGLKFELFMRQILARAADKLPTQLPLADRHPEDSEDVGAVRLSRIEAAIKETRANRAGK